MPAGRSTNATAAQPELAPERLCGPAGARPGVAQQRTVPAQVGLPSWCPCRPSRKAPPMPVMIGVDPHKASHTAASLDEHGQVLDKQRVAATLEGLPDPAGVGCTMAGPALGGRGCPRDRPGAGPAAGRRRRARGGRAGQAGHPGAGAVGRPWPQERPRRRGLGGGRGPQRPRPAAGRHRGPGSGAALVDQAAPGPGGYPHPDHQPAASAAGGPGPGVAPGAT